MTDSKNNTGRRNTGDWNTGHRNTGHRNTGRRNTGDWNTGRRNTGDCNTGRRNTGDWNTGDRNTGDCNTGHRNTGDWNAGDYNTGFFNTQTHDKMNVFDVLTSREEWNKCNKPDFIYFSLTEWVSESDMSDEEKADNPSYKTTEGYLKSFDYKEAFQASYNRASEEDRKKIFNLPNFDADKFLEISGIDVRIDSEKESKKAALIEKANELEAQVKALLKQAEDM